MNAALSTNESTLELRKSVVNKGFIPTPIAKKRLLLKEQLVRGFTLVELLITISILAFTLCAILLSYINLFFLSDLSRDLSWATNSLQTRMEDIKKTNFDDLSSLNGTTFDIDGFTTLNAKGLIEVANTTYVDLRRVRLVACFKSRGRLIGEDRNLNGTLDTGEDTNSNNRMDSPVEVVTLIAR